MHHLSTVPHHDFSIFIFDKDGTITPHNAPMTEKFAEKFRDFLAVKKAIILTARDFPICESHILSFLGDEGRNLIFACSNGTEIYRYDSGQWTKVSQLEGNIDEYRDSFMRAKDILSDILGYEALFERRSDGMGALVCLPSGTPNEERAKFDPDRKKRWDMIAKIAHLFPECYEIIPGGMSSIDISLSNKKHGLEHITRYLGVESSHIVYFGDSFDNGNDTPILEIDGITTVAVKNPEDTMQILERLMEG